MSEIANVLGSLRKLAKIVAQFCIFLLIVKLLLEAFQGTVSQENLIKELENVFVFVVVYLLIYFKRT